VQTQKGSLSLLRGAETKCGHRQGMQACEIRVPIYDECAGPITSVVKHLNYCQQASTLFDLIFSFNYLIRIL
jgi:hypothetical protein